MYKIVSMFYTLRYQKLTIKIMKIEEVKSRLLQIEKCKLDDEMAHSYEDNLFHDFVESIKNGEYKTRKEIIEIATELLKVREIDFARWCS